MEINTKFYIDEGKRKLIILLFTPANKLFADGNECEDLMREFN